jgi:hypothetical protein
MDRKTGTDRDKRSQPRPWWGGLNGAAIGIAICIPVAVTATMTTTGIGMHTIFGNWEVAAVMTVLTEAVLFATSWMLGKDIARFASGDSSRIAAGRGLVGNLTRGLFLLGTFGLVFFICWFFSFNFYFNRMFFGGEDQLEAEQQPHQAADPKLSKLRTLVDEAIRADAALILKQPGVGEYLHWLETLEQQASDPAIGGLVRAQQDRENQARLAHRQETQAKIDHLEAKLTDLTRTRQQLEASLPKQQKDNDDALADIARLTAQLDDLGSREIAAKAAAAGEDAQGGDGRPPGEGPEWKKKNEAALELARQIALIQSKQLDPRGKEQHDLEARLAGTKGKLAETVREIELVEQQIAEAREELPSDLPVAGAAPDPLPQVGPPLVAAREGFTEKPSAETYQALAKACEPVVKLFGTIPEIAAKLAGGECLSDAVDRALQSRTELLALQGEFAATCSPGIVDQHIASYISQLRGDLEAPAAGSGAVKDRRGILAEPLARTQREIVSPCLALAERAGVATGETDPIREDMHLFVQRHTLAQNAFSQTRNAVSELFDGTANNAARLGAAIAFAQDLFLLLLSILADLLHRDRELGAAPRRPVLAAVDWGARRDDPPGVAAAKLILAAARDGSRGSAVLPRNYAAKLSDDQRGNAAQIIRRLARAGTVRRGFFTGKLVLDPAAVEEIERIVLEHALLQPRPSSRSGQGAAATATHTNGGGALERLRAAAARDQGEAGVAP